jgi:hypothetical protein
VFKSSKQTNIKYAILVVKSNSIERIKPMAEVGKPRSTSSPRLPMGPKTIDKIDKPVNNPIDKLVDNSIDDNLVLDELFIPVVETKEQKEAREVKELEEKKSFKELNINDLKIPLAPSRIIQGENIQKFYAWLEAMKPEHWVQLTWYMYRTYPRIIRPDQEKNIDVGQYPINDDWILKHHGSGDYMVLVNIAGAPKNARTLCTAYVRGLDHPDYPPQVKMNELDVHYKGNRVYVDKMVVEGKLTADLKPMTPNNGNIASGDLIGLIGKLIDKADRQQLNNNRDPKDVAMATAFDIIAKGNQTATQMMLEQMKQDSPEKLMTLITAISNMTNNKSQGNGGDGMLSKFLEIMAKKDETIITLMTKMMENQSKVNAIPVVTPPVDAEVQFDKTMDRMTKMMEFSEVMGGGGGKKSTFETIMQYAGPLVANLLGVAQNYMAMRSQNVPVVNPANNPGGYPTTNTNINPQSPMQVSTAVLTPDENGEVSVDNVTNINKGKPDVREVMQSGNQQQQAAIQNGLKQIVPRIVDAINRGTSGDAFADSIEKFLGPVVYDQLASLGKANIMTILKSDPQQWQMLAPMEGLLSRFIDEFISYGEADTDEVEETKPGVLTPVVEG